MQAFLDTGYEAPDAIFELKAAYDKDTGTSCPPVSADPQHLSKSI
jgi:hypothetical protein